MALIDRVWAIVKRKRLEEDPSGKHSEFVKICEIKRIQISEHHKISGLDWESSYEHSERLDIGLLVCLPLISTEWLEQYAMQPDLYFSIGALKI